MSSTLLTAGLAHALAVRYDLTGAPETASAAIGAYQLAAGDDLPGLGLGERLQVK